MHPQSTFLIPRTSAFGLLVALAFGCGADDRIEVAGRVTVDGQPLPQGVLHLESIGLAEPRRSGAAVVDGAFSIPSDKGLPPGTYHASAEGFRKTGKMVKDPQRGDVEEIVPVGIRQEPVEIEVTNENSASLEIELKSR